MYSTKHRQSWVPKIHRDVLFAYQTGIFNGWDSPAIVIGGVEDHVHALFALSKNHPLEEDCRGSEEGEFEVDKELTARGIPSFTGRPGMPPFP